MPIKLVKRPGRKYWHLSGTVRGIAVRESTRTDSKQKAEEIRALLEAQLLERSIHGHKATATFVEAAVAYMDGGGETLYLQPIIDAIGSLPLAKLDQLAIDKLAVKLYPDASPATRNRQAYTPISAVLHFAAKRGLTEHRPIERPAIEDERIRWITFEEANRLIAACAKHLRPLIVFLLCTGARMSEALYLDWRDVELARAHVTFPATKNGEARGVPLDRRVLAELAALRHREGRVFLTNRGVPYAEKPDGPGGGQIKTAFNAACRRAGIEDFSPHDCRHTWATWHYAANRDLIGLMKLGGWKSERMVLRYAHVNVSQLEPSIKAALANWTLPKPRKQTARRSKVA